MSPLAEACDLIGRLLPEALALAAEPDISGATAGHSQPASRPPWNAQAADAAMDAHEGLRRLEASLRLAVTGHPGRRRGGSDASTAEAIAAIEALGSGVTAAAAARAAAILDRWSRAIQELPAIDTAEPWRKLPGAACPYCEKPMVYVQPRAGRVACLRGGACLDTDGQPPRGRIETGRSGPQVRWDDGLVAP
jgi:hypothetical protein